MTDQIVDHFAQRKIVATDEFLEGTTSCAPPSRSFCPSRSLGVRSVATAQPPRAQLTHPLKDRPNASPQLVSRIVHARQPTRCRRHQSMLRRPERRAARGPQPASFLTFMNLSCPLVSKSLPIGRARRAFSKVRQDPVR